MSNHDAHGAEQPTPETSRPHAEEKETEFHYPVGKLDEEVVETSSGRWAASDFDATEFDFDESDFDESEFGEPEFGDDFDEDYADEDGNEPPEALTEEEWERLSETLGFEGDNHTEEHLATVAIVGRPNVGKSSLVNRFLGRREAVVEDHPGVTRDRISYVGEWNGQRFLVQDTGGWDPNVKGIHRAIARQAEVAMETADVIVMVVDTKVGITETDAVMARRLHKSSVPVILVANKFDSDSQYADVAEFYALGLGDPWPVSAQHGRGGADVLDEVLRSFPEEPRSPSITSGPRRVALVGKPNVGKSSLLNKFTGEERSVVDNVAGTTVDPVDSLVQLDKQLWRFVDTAGLRKKVNNAQGHEYYASLRTRGVIDAAEVCIMLIDASQEISEQDQRVLNMVLEAGKALVIAFNKWDLMDEDRRYYLDREIDEQLTHLPWVSRVNISAETGRALQRLEPAMIEALESWDQRVSTGQLNNWMREAIAANPPPMKNNRLPRVLFATQASTQPPTIVLFTTGFLDAGYRRYLERKFRERFGFHGSPVRIAVRVRERRNKKGRR
ncbi:MULTISPECIES: ribosome biogenesis GTPase Der [Corynebacterium]|uniref:ribosome biogenesis GTPase Der n=1 Tax=Corynebacterium TaxID=1716 RepID=UPI00257FF164|nr:MULTISPECIES: ribosome biogenesis GTPase Der [Corynebacterium]